MQGGGILCFALLGGGTEARTETHLPGGVGLRLSVAMVAPIASFVIRCMGSPNSLLMARGRIVSLDDGGGLGGICPSDRQGSDSYVLYMVPVCSFRNADGTT